MELAAVEKARPFSDQQRRAKGPGDCNSSGERFQLARLKQNASILLNKISALASYLAASYFFLL